MTETLARETSAVSDYVAAVRAALADLPAEDVDELTGGLEADLAEHLAERPLDSDLTSILGTAQTYAAELRTAAGLPQPPAPITRISMGWQATATVRELGGRLLRRWPWLADLRAVWWLTRGLALGVLLAIAVVPVSREGLVVAGAVGAVMSFIWGRRALGRGPRRAAVFWLVMAVNAGAVLALLPVASILARPRVEYVTEYSTPTPAAASDGTASVWVNGEPASNIYAFDADGKRIGNVRLFNQYGQALSINPDQLATYPEGQGPPIGADGLPEVNRSVFPLHWGTLNGWQPSTGGWEPPVQISKLPPSLIAGTEAATENPVATPSSTATSPAGTEAPAGTQAPASPSR